MTDAARQDASLAESLTPEGMADPYPIYDRIRSDDPVHWDQQLNQWLLMRYADVVAVSRDPRFSAVRVVGDVDWLPAEHREALAPVFLSISRQMLFLDPPDHTRIRGLMVKAFSPRILENLRSRIQSLVDGLLDGASQRGSLEVMEEFAVPLPAIVIAEMLGVPPEDREQFQRWSEDFGAIIGGAPLTGEQAAQHLLGVRDLVEYFREIVDQHRNRPQNDLLQAMINAEEAGDRLSADELFANAVLLIAAGHLTTAGLIGNGLYTLLDHPDARRGLIEHPEIIGSAVEEILRFESPIQATGRRLLEDVELGGRRLEAGQDVLLHLGSANRDPERFPEPNTFDIGRQDNRHMAFSQGIHFCLGSALARMEGQIAIGTFLSRFPNARLSGTAPEWETDLISRGVRSLELILG